MYRKKICPETPKERNVYVISNEHKKNIKYIEQFLCYVCSKKGLKNDFH